MKLIFLDKVDSTNEYVKRYVKGGESVAVAAKTQTGGKGTKGRSFISDEGGVYVSVLKFYDGLPAEKAYSIVSDTAVAVVKTLKTFGVDATIKWPNDIFAQGKKICGILTENSLSVGKVVYSVIGIGINVNNDIAQEITDIAISVKQVTGREVNYDAVLATLLFNLEQKQEVGLYARYSCVLGRKIQVIKSSGEVFDAVCEDILSDGRLKLKGGEILTAAEIKLYKED